MWTFLACHRRQSHADRGMLVLSTPTKMSASSPWTDDHTPKPTEIVGNVGAWGNVRKTFVATTQGTSNTLNPCPTLVLQVTKANARPDFPKTKCLFKSGQENVTCQRSDESQARSRRDDARGSAVDDKRCRRRSSPAGRQPATTSIPSCSHNGANPAMMPQFRHAMKYPCVYWVENSSLSCRASSGCGSA